MLRRIGLSCGIIVLVASAHVSISSAHAAERRDWSFAAGLGLGTLGLGGFGGLGGLGALIRPELGLERRVSDAWWLRFGASASHQDTDGLASTDLGGSIGARFVMRPDDRVRLALRGDVAARRAWQESNVSVDGSDQLYESARSSLTASLGFDVELEVVDGFALRVDVAVLELSHAWGEVRVDDVPSGSEGLAAALALRPTVLLVWSL